MDQNLTLLFLWLRSRCTEDLNSHLDQSQGIQILVISYCMWLLLWHKGLKRSGKQTNLDFRARSTGASCCPAPTTSRYDWFKVFTLEFIPWTCSWFFFNVLCLKLRQLNHYQDKILRHLKMRQLARLHWHFFSTVIHNRTVYTLFIYGWL